LNALVNTASGASWVSIHHGGGVGMGRSLHAGQVSVADGTELAAQKLRRVLTNDPGMGVIRHVDAGYPEAEAVAEREGLRIPMRGGGHRAMSDGFDRLWADLEPIGRHPGTGGYRRYTFGAADAELRSWFAGAAASRGLDVETDGNGNMWAWWGAPGPGAVVTGSHLDSVPDGGAFDGPLGVVSALEAVAELRRRGFAPARPVAVAVFAEEEGARFGVPCLGSRLLTGAIAPERAAALTDADGVTWAEAMAGAGFDPAGLGPDPERAGRIGAFVELHVEQGRALADTGDAVGAARSIWPHGRWRLEFTGRADHAGTTRLADRRDP